MYTQKKPEKSIWKLLPKLIISISLLATIVLLFSISVPTHAAGTVTGRVFQDYNGNGVYNTAGNAANPAIDKGVSGVTVTAYDNAGAVRGTAVTGNDGTYSLSATGTGRYRLEFTNLPAGYFPSARSTDSVNGGTTTNAGTSVQFVPDGSTSNVNLAINYPDDYSQANPRIATTIMVNGDQVTPDNFLWQTVEVTDWSGGDP